MPRIRSDEYGTGDQTWLGSTHGIYNCRTGTLTTESFTPNESNAIPSGTPVNAADESAVVPWDGGDGGALGFVFTDQSVADAGDTIQAPILRHGIINVRHLPVDFTPPTAGGAFTFVGTAADDGGGEPGGDETGGEV